MQRDRSQVKDDVPKPGPGPIERPSSSTKGVITFGIFVVMAIFLGLGGWAATAPLDQAVSAGATLTKEGERKRIQHFEGGIVGSLNVTEGQFVEKGELLLSLNPLQATAAVARHNGQLNQALVGSKASK